MAEYNPLPLTTDETHTRIELYEKLKARERELDPKEFPHRFPDADGHFDTLKGDYVRDQDPAEVSRKMTDVKRRKKAIRPSDWSKFNYHKTFRGLRKQWLEVIEKIDQAHLKNEKYESIESIDRFDFRDVSYEWFVQNYEAASIPCMISGFGDDMPINKYSYSSMARGFLANERVKVGKDDEGYPIRIETRNYIQYASENKDDSPVYLFESQIAANPNISKIIADYSRPAWFSKDLLDYCHTERRPPHRWFCVGPERSGTTVHCDPLCLNAWNTCVSGRKLWIMFSPDVPEDIATGTRFMSKGSDKPSPNIENEAVGWYDRVYVPKIRPFLHANAGKYRCIEAIQYPGETIFVPSSPQGWWHFVLNLDDTLAYTQNYCNMSNFEPVWKSMRVERKHTAQRWLHNLSIRYPLAADVAKRLDKEDKFSIQFKKPSLRSKYRRRVEALREKSALHGVNSLTAAEQSDLESSASYDPRNKSFGPTDLPFAYEGWENWSGGEDSSTDSDSSDDDSSDDEAAAPSTSSAKPAPEKPISAAAAAVIAASDPAYSQFAEGFQPQYSQEYIDAKVNTIKGKREPHWSAEDWYRFNYASSFPAMRRALVQWVAHVEAGTLTSAGPGKGRNDGRAELNCSAGPHGVLSTADGSELPPLTAEALRVILPSSALQPLAVDRADAALKGADVCKPCVTAFDRFQAIPRFHYKDMTYEQFQADFERPLRPCMISGMTQGWAMNDWTMQSLCTGKYRDSMFKVGRDQQGYRLTMQLRHYLHYLSSARDDLPLYLFESSLETMPVGEQIRQDYVRPHFFENDLFDLVDFNRRPPQRWLTIGPQGSGTHMHIDPLGATNAWNSLTHGRKYWLLLSPNVPEHIAGAVGMKRKDRQFHGTSATAPEDGGPTEISSAQGWWWKSLPELRMYVSKNPDVTLHEVIQYPGDTIFVPGGWHHAVINLDHTCAITQNYCNDLNFSLVWRAVRERRVHMAQRWLTTLDKARPELAAEARRLDALDNFVCKFSRGSLRRKAARKQRIAAREQGQEVSDHTSDDEQSGEWDSSSASDDSD